MHGIYIRDENECTEMLNIWKSASELNARIKIVNLARRMDQNFINKISQINMRKLIEKCLFNSH